MIELRKADRKTTPKDKLACFIAAYKLVIDSIDLFSKKKGGAGADDSTPVIIYLLMQSSPIQMMSTIKYFAFSLRNSYIDAYWDSPGKANAQAKYIYMTIKSAVMYLNEYSP